MRTAVKASPVRASFTNLGLCEQHKDAARLSDFLSESSWDKIVRYMREAGKPAPKRHLTTLRFIVVSSPESTDAVELPF
jgi:hypothetical protein